MDTRETPNGARYGMVVDLDKCNGCGACAVACAVENNVPPAARARDRAQRHHLAARAQARVPGRPPGRVRSDAVPAVRREDPVRLRLPAERGRGGSRLGHRRADPGALPRLPLLHGRVSLPRALLQLVGPRLAGRARRDAQPRGLDADARRRREVHLLQPPAAGGPGRPGRGGRRDARPPSYTPACVEACPAGAIVFGNLNDPQGEVARLAAGARLLPPARAAGHGRQGLLPQRARLGAAPRRRPRRRRATGGPMDERLVPRGLDARPARPLPALARALGGAARRSASTPPTCAWRWASTRRTWTTASPSASGSTWTSR